PERGPVEASTPSSTDLKVAVSPRSPERGPVEAAKEMNAGRLPRSLRALRSAAPLKHPDLRVIGFTATPLRALRSAAPLKHAVGSSRRIGSVSSPRSPERGPVEACVAALKS